MDWVSVAERSKHKYYFYQTTTSFCNTTLPRAALEGNRELKFLSQSQPTPEAAVIPFQDPDPFQEFTYPSRLAAKRAIADYLALPLARLSEEQMAFIDKLLAETLNKKVILEWVQHYFKGRREDRDAH